MERALTQRAILGLFRGRQSAETVEVTLELQPPLHGFIPRIFLENNRTLGRAEFVDNDEIEGHHINREWLVFNLRVGYATLSLSQSGSTTKLPCAIRSNGLIRGRLGVDTKEIRLNDGDELVFPTKAACDYFGNTQTALDLQLASGNPVIYRITLLKWQSNYQCPLCGKSLISRGSHNCVRPYMQPDDEGFMPRKRTASAQARKAQQAQEAKKRRTRRQDENGAHLGDQNDADSSAPDTM